MSTTPEAAEQSPSATATNGHNDPKWQLSSYSDDEMPQKDEILKDDEDFVHSSVNSRKGGPFPGDDDFDENNAPVQFVIDEWAQGTSIHGVPFVTDAATWRVWKRTMWVVLVCVSSSFMIWQFTALIQQYRSYEVITDTETINPTSLEFPEITICNMNTFSRKRMEELNIESPKNEEELFAISAPLDEFIVQARFNGRPLVDLDKHFKSNLMEWGRCWVFRTDERVYRTGYYGGLQFYANIQQHDFDPVSQFAGVAVWAQQPGTLVTSQLPVFPTETGKETLVTIRRTEFQREKQLPWARCTSQAPEYTQSKCRTECWNKNIAEKCGCRRYSDFISPKSLPFCEKPYLMDSKDAICAGRVMADESVNLKNCDCDLPSCSQIEYYGQVLAVNPSHVLLENFNFTGWDSNKTHMVENFVSITVNYDRLQYDLLTESKAMSFADLLASIGGSMGFFLGISMLSVFELIGDLGLLRLVPRLFGQKNLYGLGARKQNKHD